MEKTYLGIEIGGTKLQLAVADAALKIIQTHHLRVEQAAGAAGIRQQIELALAKILETTTLTAIGVGFGGPVDWRSGKICRSHQIEGWSDFDLSGWLSKLTGAPVFVDNDANVAALGEAQHGAERGANPVFYVTLGSGVGGGLVIDGKIYHGATPGESELGHVRLDRAGTTVESQCSGWAVDEKIRALKNESTVLAKMIGDKVGGEAQFLAEALKQHDPVAQKILQELAENLAFGLSHVTHLFHPATIVIGGGLAKIGEPLRVAISQALSRWVMEAFAPGPRVCLTKLGDAAVPMGALTLAQRE